MNVSSNGKAARLGGVVTQSDFSGIPAGTPMTWSVSDNTDKPDWKKQDAASALYAGVDPAAYCALGLAYPEVPLVLGNLTITK
jgi:hypothetical protein